MKTLLLKKENAEEDYIITPISVLAYISALEKSQTEREIELVEFVAQKYGFKLELGREIAEQVLKEFNEQ